MKEPITIETDDVSRQPGSNGGNPRVNSSAPFNELMTKPPKNVGALRVLHVINSFGVGGTERGVLKLMAGLPRNIFEQRLCAIRDVDEQLAASANVSGHVLRAGQGGGGFKFLLFRLLRLLKAFRPHIVHSRNWGAIEVVPAGWMANVPVVIHSEHGYELDMLTGIPLRRRLVRRAVYPMCDAVFTVSRELRDYHSRQAWYPTDRIKVISNGVDSALFAPDPQVRQRVRSEYQYSADTFVIGTAGRLVPIKDLTTLLRAAESLTRRDFKVSVLVAGAGPELESLQSYVQTSQLLAGRVRFTGLSSNLPELFQVMDVFVLPSLSEGMSNTLLEAMSSGLACIATDVGGNPELVEDGKSGFLFQPRDVNELADRLELLIRETNTRKQVAAAARTRAVTEFSLERMIENYTQFYVELAMLRGIVPGKC